MQERKLEDIAVSNGVWHEASREMLANGWGIKEQSDHYALDIAKSVVRGAWELENLRDEVSALNDLDAQAVEIAEGNIANLNTDDFKEAVARRIGHHATRTALRYVRTNNRQISLFRHIMLFQSYIKITMKNTYIFCLGIWVYYVNNIEQMRG